MNKHLGKLCVRNNREKRSGGSNENGPVDVLSEDLVLGGTVWEGCGCGLAEVSFSTTLS